MNYGQWLIPITNAEQSAPLVVLLWQLPILGIEEKEEGLLLSAEEQHIATITAHLNEIGQTFQFLSLPEKNWNANWEADFKPIVVDQFCAIRAHFHAPINNVVHQLIITPQMSFGTGHHATTQLMIKMISGLDFSNKTVLDFGTGTGVLAILAEKMGAASVLAIDNDKWSIENAQQNLVRNHTKHVIIKDTPIEEVSPSRYAIILANINRHVLIQYLATMKSKLCPDGVILLSGILIEDESLLNEAAQKIGLQHTQTMVQDQWISMMMAM